MYDILKDILREREVGLEEFAQSLGITLNTLRRSLQANPTVSKIQEIADKLNIPISTFFPSQQSTTPEQQITGFLKVDNEIHEIKNIDDLKNLYTLL